MMTQLKWLHFVLVHEDILEMELLFFSLPQILYELIVVLNSISMPEH